MVSLEEINKRFVDREREIDEWINAQCVRVDVPIYTSVDLRVAGFKVAAVDTNIYPAGFNNLSADCRAQTSELFRCYIDRKYGRVRRIVLVAEMMSRNPYYWENVAVLRSILERAGFEVAVGLVSPELRRERVEFARAGGGKVECFKLMREGAEVFVPGFVPDLVLLNNDFSVRCPDILISIAQPIEPPLELGWHTRRKSVHFEFYNKLMGELAALVQLDPWTFSVPTELVCGVSFDDRSDREKVAGVVEDMLRRTAARYREHRICSEPYVVVKSNAGTFGMAVLVARSPDEVVNLNSEGRKRMRVTKGGVPVRDVVVQEGIPTVLRDRFGAPAEPVAYMVEADVAGAFLRCNPSSDERGNLNARDMRFMPIECIYDEEGQRCFPPAARSVARVASVAAGYEIERILAERALAPEASHGGS